MLPRNQLQIGTEPEMFWSPEPLMVGETLFLEDLGWEGVYVTGKVLGIVMVNFM